MAVNLTPWNGLDVEKLKVWVHHILPLVYDDSLSYYEVLAKVGAKMNEVVEGLNANNTQVEMVTDFTIEQVQNLTAAFNNFQQSMLNRQEEFENKVLDSQQSFETQLNGDIANWEAETEEKFQNMYNQFLSDYQRQFGVVQTTGESTTDVMSQKAVTDVAFIQTIYADGVDFNTLQKSGAYVISHAENNQNMPVETIGTLFVMADNNKDGTQFYVPARSKIIYFRVMWNSGTVFEPWKTLYTLNVTQTTGESTTDVMSQKAVTDVAFIQTVYADGVDFNTLQKSGAYIISHAENNQNMPVETIGTLFVMADNDKNGTQFYVPAVSKIIYFRNMWNSGTVFEPWKTLYTLNVAQTTGESTTDVMSQKAVTDVAFIQTVYADGVDFNTLQKSGAYVISHAENNQNMPVETAGTLFVMADNYKNGAQFYVPIQSKIIYFRTMWNSGTAFEPWKTLYTLDVAQTTGESTTDVMSQKAVTDVAEIPYFTSISMFESLGAIGDSYTDGYVYTDTMQKAEINQEISYPMVIKRVFGINVSNYGQSGATTTSWLSEKWNTVENDEPKNLYTILLGFNDVTYTELGNTNDINTASSDSSNNTFYGKYTEIIKKLQKKSPKSIIMLIKLPLKDTKYTSYNEAISTIGNTLNIPVIDPFDDSFFNSKYYLSTAPIYGHPTAPVYAGMALAFSRLISKYILDNPDTFKNYTGLLN